MARVSPIINKFTSGELSPRLAGQVTLEQYYNGCETLENAIVYPHGGAAKRPGTRFVAGVKDSTRRVRLIPFIFRTGQAYVLELGPQYIRFYYNQGQVMGPTGDELATGGDFAADTGWTKGAGWSIAAGKATHAAGTAGDLSQAPALAEGTAYFVEFTVSGRTAGSLTALVNGGEGTAREADGTHQEIITAGAAGGLVLRASADFNGSVDDVSVKLTSPYEVVSPYAEDQLAAIKFAQSADVVYLAHPEVAPQKLARAGHVDWTLAPVSFTATPASWTAGNYPSAVVFFEQRLWWGGTPASPQTLWASRSGASEDLTTGTEDDDALVYTYNSDLVNPIHWLVSAGVIYVGTYGSIWTAGARSTLEAITPTNVRFDRESTYGSLLVQGRLVNKSLVYLSRYGRQVMECAYRLDTDGLETREISILGEHICRRGLVGLDWAQDPHQMLWAPRSDGQMACGTYLPSEQVLAWTRMVTDGKFESLAVIPGETRDEVWVVVARTVNGVEVRYVEFFEALFGTDTDDPQVEDAFFVDCGLTYEGEPTATLSGLDHLEGREVAILADGAVHPNRTVSGGALALEWAAAKIHVGLPYAMVVKPMRMEAGAQDGVAQGKKKRIFRVILRVLDSVGLKVGTTRDNAVTIPFRRVEHAMGEAIPLYTGDTDSITPPGGANREGQLVIVHDEPLPLHLVAILPQAQVDDQ